MKEKLLKALQDKDFSELFKKGGVSFLMRVGGQVLGFALTLIISRFFGAKGLGDYVLAIIVLRIFSLIAKLGLDTFSLRFISALAIKNDWKSIFYLKRKANNVLIISSLLLSVILFISSGFISSFIGIEKWYLQLNAFIVIPLTFFMLHYQSLRGLKKIAEFSFFYGPSQALFSILIIIIALNFTDSKDIPIYSYAVSTVVVFLLSKVILDYWLRKKKDFNATEKLSELTTFSILRVSSPFLFVQAVQLLLGWTDKLMLSVIVTPNISSGVMSSSEEVGIYHTVVKLSMFAGIFLMSINSISAPKFSELYSRNDLSALERVSNQSSKMIFWLSLPLVIIFFTFPRFFLGIFGEEFKTGVYAFILLSCGRLISSFAGSAGSMLQMTGNQFIYMNILGIGLLINIVLNYIFIPIFGMNGAAFSSMMSLVAWNVGMVWAVRKKLGFYTCYMPFVRL